MSSGKTYNFSEKVILIVEDTETSNRFYNAALSRTNATLLWALNGDEALKRVEEHSSIDAILLDLNLPGMSGFEVLKTIRITNKEVPIIVQTAYVLSGEEATCYELGATDFISKPIMLDHLLGTLNKYLLGN
ncbi:MAG: response regulator [Bacteroidales bacterium]|jgi:CheY-like chemotaxis protein|nr:response regulator [Bacteroidales bacterium]